jgi:PPOX class probable F420-dependent enzyme
MIDWSNDLGRRALARIQHEEVIWLTTISKSGFPQPRPVWFVWENETFLIYSLPTAHKIQHIAGNPNTALHFNTDPSTSSGQVGGEDVQVFLGTARVDADAPAVKHNRAYREKYRAGIVSIGMTEDTYSAQFSVAIRITPARLRGLEPLPQN